MITRAKFENYKALRNVEITFDSRLTVIVGPNGSGKTSVLRGLDDLLVLGSGVPFSDAVNIRPWMMYLKYHPEDRIFLELTGYAALDGSEAGLRMELKSREHRGASGLHDEDVAIRYRAGSTDGKWQPVSSSSPPVLGGATFAQLDPGLLAQATYPTGGFPYIAPSGEGLASALAGIALNDPLSFQQITKHLQSIVNQVRGIRFNRFESDREERESTQPDPQLIRLMKRKHITEALLFDFAAARGVHATEVSDGTLLILGMLSLIYAFPNSAVLLLDDLDHGLHPKAQMDLVGLLRKLLDEFPNLQIIATSHSPYILDRLEWNEVRVTALNDDGSAVCEPLTAHPLYERWKSSMSPGEFWSHGGEDWVRNRNGERVAQ
jgi:Fe-S cluster assembly ATPase SufC